MLAALVAWDGLAAELYSAASSYQSVVSGLASGPWLGPSSASMAAAAAPYVAWVSATAAQAEQTATQARMAATAYETAFAATVPPPLIAANRSLLMALVATNFFGQNTPAIAATETQYAEMWAQDVAAMYGYAGASASATTLTPFTPPLPSTNPGAPAAQAATVAQATATSAATNTQTVLSHLTSAVPTALRGLASPLQSTPAATPAASGLTGILDSLGISPLGTPLGIVDPEGLPISIGAWNAAAQASDMAHATRLHILGLGDQILNRIDQLGPVATVGSAGSASLGAGGGPVAVSAGLGQTASVGGLSVPQGWTTAAPAIRPVAVALPANSLSVAPEGFAGGPGTLFSEMTAASLAARAIGGTASSSRRTVMARPPAAG